MTDPGLPPHSTGLDTDALETGETGAVEIETSLESASLSIGAFADHLDRIGINLVPRPNQESGLAIGHRLGWASSDTVSNDTVSIATDPTQGDSLQSDSSHPPAVVGTDHPQSKSKPASADAVQQTTGPSPSSRPIDQKASDGHRSPAIASSSGLGAKAYPPGMAEDQRSDRLEQLANQVAGCQSCSILAGCRKNTVFGEGSVTPRVAFFGEGPGADEDRTGRPFVGAAGQLLDKMMLACSFQRSDVYILNTVKCRPPGNRNPLPDEIGNCRPYFEQQLEILQPEYIVCLGLVAAQTLLESKLSVGKMRGQLHRYRDSKVLVTYHPAYLLRNPKAKGAAWTDLKILLADAGINLPPPAST